MENIIVNEDCRIPGTDIILEAGDSIQLIESISSKEKEDMLYLDVEDFISKAADMEMYEKEDWNDIEKLMKEYAKENGLDFNKLRKLYGDELKKRNYE